MIFVPDAGSVQICQFAVKPDSLIFVISQAKPTALGDPLFILREQVDQESFLAQFYPWKNSRSGQMDVGSTVEVLVDVVNFEKSE